MKTAVSLNQTTSCLNHQWLYPSVDDETVRRMMQVYNLPDVVARILTARGIRFDDVDGFLNPRLATHFPDPFAMTAMAGAADFLADAVKTGRKIAIFGDFDVDGATSSALMILYFRHLGIDPRIYIPERLTEGYGPNNAAFDQLKAEGHDMVILADCGTTAFDTIAYGRSIGLDIIILDHHEAEDSLPSANFVVNPKRKDDNSGYTYLAAVGVSYLMMVALNNRLDAAGYFAERSTKKVDMRLFLDLVALGTICDMVPLLGANRLFVRHGLHVMGARGNVGIDALCRVAGVDGAPGLYEVGYWLGPRINAGSRMDRSDMGALLLSCRSREEAAGYAQKLNECNAERQAVQTEMTAEAIGVAAAENADDKNIIIVSRDGWHAGLIGLVAGKLKDKYKKPACVVAFGDPNDPDGGDDGKGSGRSIPGVSIAAAFIDARNAGLLIKGGGHAMAGGFTVARDKFDALKTFLDDHVAKQLGGTDPVHQVTIDGALAVSGMTVDLVKMLDHQLGPFGMGFEEPVFAVPAAKIINPSRMKDTHLRCMIVDSTGGAAIKAVAFGAVDTPLGRLIENTHGAPVHLVGRLKLNSWQGRESAEFHILDAQTV